MEKLSKRIFVSSGYFETAFGEHIQKDEKLELIEGDYSEKCYMRFGMIDYRGTDFQYGNWPPSVTITKNQIEQYLTEIQ